MEQDRRQAAGMIYGRGAGMHAHFYFQFVVHDERNHCLTYSLIGIQLDSPRYALGVRGARTGFAECGTAARNRQAEGD
jgi:hypothetical protein